MNSSDRGSSSSKKLSTRKKIAFAIFALSFALLATAVSLEIAFRVYKYNHPGRFYSTHISDPALGWYPRSGRHSAVRTTLKSKNDEPWTEGVEDFYFVDERGFRRWNEGDASGPVVLVVGDSFTEAEYAGSGGTYFDRFSREIPCRSYVFGCSGYGTLQETLLLERYINTIRPDIVILQMCDNDLFNNDPDLIQANMNWDPGQAVPILQEDGSVRMQGIRYTGFAKTLVSRSLLVPYLIRRFGLVPFASSFEYRGTPAYEQAVKRTGRILERFRASCGKETKVLAYAECTGADPDAEEAIFRRLCEASGIVYMDRVSGALRDEELKAGNPQMGRCDGPRGHYNLFGHLVIGKAIVPHLRKAIESLNLPETTKPAGN